MAAARMQGAGPAGAHTLSTTEERTQRLRQTAASATSSPRGVIQPIVSPNGDTLFIQADEPPVPSGEGATTPTSTPMRGVETRRTSTTRRSTEPSSNALGSAPRRREGYTANLSHAQLQQALQSRDDELTQTRNEMMALRRRLQRQEELATLRQQLVDTLRAQQYEETVLSEGAASVQAELADLDAASEFDGLPPPTIPEEDAREEWMGRFHDYLGIVCGQTRPHVIHLSVASSI